METELGERIRTKNLKIDKNKYMDPDDKAIVGDYSTLHHRKDIHRREVGLRAYKAYQKALPTN